MIIDNYFELVLMMGAVLSFLLSMYLIFYPGNFFPNRILGALVFSWSVTVMVFIVQSPAFFNEYPHFYALFDVFALLFFPLMYLYLRNYLYRDIKKPFLQMLHYIPAVLYLLFLLPFFTESADEKRRMLQEGMPAWFSTTQVIFNIVIVLQGIFYSIFCLRMIHHFQYFREKHLSAFQLKTLSWLRLFVVINILLWMNGTTGVIFDILGIEIFIDLFKVFYGGLTIFTIVLGIFTINRPELFSESEDIRKIVDLSGNKEVKREVTSQNNQDYEELSKYISSEKPYLINDLKMQDLVESTGITYKRISEVFNKNYNKTFYEVMNEYRLEEAKSLIKQGFYKKHTLNYLAEQAGFNSKTTFNRIFKKYTGYTPSDYIKHIEEEN
ncbi:helix-turn-helix domain-containing protein [Marinigracilibium pacificum]|uniref:Helix-turn-helix transcriptional regulator n=1 Tax=Marinigracilibium pacificum TaxID=2729599 RepID=A0A848J1A8_9BACT|nr:helix-turn-helix transcriptional regulator [Marinigracilibium pacificum]NMM48330.1 helix-turn-helix transcriptional regulator [Marinigracilibium pacificum]